MKLLEFLKKHLKLVILIVVIIIIAVIAAVYFINKNSNSELDTSSLNTDVITRQTISNYVSITGTITANDNQTVYATETGLEVLKVNVKVGDEVQKGDVIAVLDSSEYEKDLATAQDQLEVDKAKTALKQQQANENLQDAQVDGLDSWKEQDIDLAESQTDYSYAQNDVNQACEDLSKARSDLQKALDDLQDEYDDADDEYDKAKKAYRSLQDESSSVVYDRTTYKYSDKDSLGKIVDDLKDKRDEFKKKLDDPEYYLSSNYNAVTSAERQVQSAQENLEKAQRNVNDATEKRADSAEDQRRKIVDATEAKQETDLDASVATAQQEDKIDELQKQVDDCTITAPISGVVTSVSMEAGNTITNDNNTICVIQDTSQYKVEGTVDEYDIAKISEGMSAVIKTEATGDTTMNGTVDFVSPTPKSSSTTTSTSSSVEYPVKIIIDKLDPNVRIGMTAETNILLETAENVLTVPYDCIGKNGDGNYVIYAADGAPSMAGRETSDSSKSEKTSGGGHGGHGGGMMGGPGEIMIGGGGNSGASESDITAEEAGREIVVNVGLITDYYVEISSDEIKEGMTVYLPSVSAIDVEDDDDSDEGNFGHGGPGGGGPGGF